MQMPEVNFPPDDKDLFIAFQKSKIAELTKRINKQAAQQESCERCRLVKQIVQEVD
jgi:hypothetical protein